MLKKIIFYGLLGWIIEVIWTGLGSFFKGQLTLESHTYLWMFPIYGMAVFLEPVHNEIREYKWWVRGFVYMTLIFIVEYSTGYFLDVLIGKCPWDYSGKIFSVNGYIRLDYGPVWFFAGLIFEQVHDNLINEVIG